MLYQEIVPLRAWRLKAEESGAMVTCQDIAQ